MTDQNAESAARREERRRQPLSLRLRSLMPSLTVDDLAASLHFYVDGLGFTLQEEWEEEGKLLGAMLVAGSCHLGLSQDDWARGRDRHKGVGMRLWAETEQPLEALAARLEEHGIAHEGPKAESWGSTSLSVEDPDGYKLSFTNPQTE